MVPVTIAAPAPSPAPPSTRRGLAARVLGAIVLMALATAGVFVYQQLRRAGPAHPGTWDPRFTQVVQFVETTRGLHFQHPIYVDLLSDADYATRVAIAAEGDATSVAARAKDRSDTVNAFGFAIEYKSTDAEGILSADSTRGTYSPSTDRISLRGTTLTPGLRVVLAHELTHALQAQHFDMHLGGSDDFTKRSIAEGDATRIEQAYLASLPSPMHDQATAENTFDTSEVSQLSRVPWPMIEIRFAPYWLGPTLVQAAVAAGGNAGVDALFEHPPSETELISPWRRDLATAASASVAAAKAEAPALVVPSGATIVQAPTALSLMQVLVMLDAWLPWSMSRGALDHWSSGRYTAYRQPGDATLCVSASATFDAAPTAFATALTFWATAAGSTAQPHVEGNTVVFRVCDRGATAKNPPFPVIGPTNEIWFENAAIPATGVTGLPAAAIYLCTARAVIDNMAVAPLLAKGALAPAQQALVDQARASALGRCTG